MDVQPSNGFAACQSRTSLPDFVTRVVERAHAEALHERFDESQRALLDATVSRIESMFHVTDAAQPLNLMYLLLRAWGREPDERAIQVATAALLYFCAGDLIDDIQDGDLAGKPHEHAGLPIAVNNGLTLVVLLLDSLRRGMQLEPNGERGMRYLEAFLRNGLHSLRCQHADLEGIPLDTSPDVVLKLQQGKVQSIATMMEFGALLAGCGVELQAHYSRAGAHLGGMIQIIDDLRDIFAKDESPDLRDGKMTYPLACFLQQASEEQCKRLDELRTRLPESMPDIRELFYDAGAVVRCADTLDELRHEFHREIACTRNTSAQHRLLLLIADALAETVYRPESIAQTEAIFSPEDYFTCELRAYLLDFTRNLSGYPLPESPKLVPWHLPHLEYDPDRRAIFYPDIAGLGEEVLPFHVALYRTTQAVEASEILRAAAPVLLPHEMFHFLRDQNQMLTEDRWHEEYVANRLAVAYGQRYCPAALARALNDVERVLANDFDRQAADAILARCKTPALEPRGYEADSVTVAAVHARMVQELAILPLDMESEFATLLGMRSAAVVAAE